MTTCADSLRTLERAIVAKNLRILATETAFRDSLATLYGEREQQPKAIRKAERRARGQGRRQGAAVGAFLALLLAALM